MELYLYALIFLHGMDRVNIFVVVYFPSTFVALKPTPPSS
jgi:hypothetical protein